MCVHTLEVGPLQPCFAIYEVSLVHVNLLPLLAKPGHHVLPHFAVICHLPSLLLLV